MINLDTIEHEIIDLEKKDTSYAVIERLAWLYTVRDHLIEDKRNNERTGDMSGSCFCEACSNVPVSQLIDVLSEHMEAVSVLYPKEYDSIMQKIKSLK